MCFHMGASPASRCLELETLFYEAWARLVAEQKRATPPTPAHPRLAGCQMCEAVLDFLAPSRTGPSQKNHLANPHTRNEWRCEESLDLGVVRCVAQADDGSHTTRRHTVTGAALSTLYLF